MFQFHWPWCALLLLLPFLARALLKGTRNDDRKLAPAIRFPAINSIKNAFPHFQTEESISTGKSFPLCFAIWVFMTLAVMRPELVDHFTEVNNKGYDLMLAVDLSASMQALDFSTQLKKKSRLDAAKEVVGKFVLGRQGDRVGLITFGDSAYLYVPLTLDTLSVSKMLNDVVSGMAGNSTAIGDAIGLSVKTLRHRPEGSRVLVLLTDGEDNASSIPPMEAAGLAKEYGIRIYTIGIGKNGPVPFPSQFGGYTMAEMPLDEELLKKIALATGGKFFRAHDQNALEKIYENIDAMEKSEADQNVFLVRKPLYHYPLALSLVLMLLIVLQPLYRRGPVGI